MESTSQGISLLRAVADEDDDGEMEEVERDERDEVETDVSVCVCVCVDGEVGEGRDGRGLKTAALGNALLALGKLTLGQETVDRLTPVVQGIQQISHILPAVEFKDGRIVVATTSTSTTSTTTTTTTTTTPEPTTTATTTTTTEASTKTAEAAPQSVQGNASPHRACTTPDRNQGRCQDLSSCPSLLLNLANLRQSICFQSIFTPGVCCPNSAPTNAIESLLHHLTSSTAATTTTSTTTTRRPTESAYRPGTSTTSTTTTTTTPSTARPAVPETNQGRGEFSVLFSFCFLFVCFVCFFLDRVGNGTSPATQASADRCWRRRSAWWAATPRVPAPGRGWPPFTCTDPTASSSGAAVRSSTNATSSPRPTAPRTAKRNGASLDLT